MSSGDFFTAECPAGGQSSGHSQEAQASHWMENF